MGVRITCQYIGNKRVEAVHLDSGTIITTSAPKDNQGDGLAFSPTDLVAAALGSCMLTVMAILADRVGINMTGAHAELDKHMSADTPRRIVRIAVQLHLPAKLAHEDRARLEGAALACPVHKSLHPDVEAHPEFYYDVD